MLVKRKRHGYEISTTFRMGVIKLKRKTSLSSMKESTLKLRDGIR